MRILIVDDDPATVSFMRMAFVSADHIVDTASSVDEAIASIAAAPPDIVLSDLTFGRDSDPTADGFVLLDALRRRSDTAHAGILAVSGADAPDVLRAAEHRGFDGFVSKPVDVASLLDRVHRLGETVASRRAADRSVDRT